MTCVLVHYRGAITITGFSTISGILSYCFMQMAHNFFIDRATFWHELIMHHTFIIKENSEQNLHIWLNFVSFFQSWQSRMLPLGRFRLSFNVISIYPSFITSYDQLSFHLSRFSFYIDICHCYIEF